MKKNIFLIIAILLLISTISFATISNFDSFKPSADNTFKVEGSKVIGALQLISAMFAIGTLAILGIRFMLSSPDGKAQIKSQMVPYLIGAVMGFAMVPILGILYNIFKD